MSHRFVDHKKEFCRIIDLLSRKYERHRIFVDFCEVATLCIRQSLERTIELEEKYMQIAKSYSSDEMKFFAELLSIVMLALEERPRDFLGECFNELELHNSFKGQFFTPFSLSLMIARMILPEMVHRRNIFRRVAGAFPLPESI